MILLKPVLLDEDKTQPLYAGADCQRLFESYPAYYYKTGYAPPWIGYFVLRDEVVVGVGGFISEPKNGTVEIAYGTFDAYQRQGIAGVTCTLLIAIAEKMNPQIIITAKTSPEENPSNRILKQHGFVYTGVVQDEGIGDAWHWELKKNAGQMISDGVPTSQSIR